MKHYLVQFQTTGTPEWDESGTYIIGYNNIETSFYLCSKEEYYRQEPDPEIGITKVVAEFDIYDWGKINFQLSEYIHKYDFSKKELV